MFKVQECPACGSVDLVKFGEAKDTTVSHQIFMIVRCVGCELLITSPRPNDVDLGSYYESPDYVSHAAKTTSTFDKIYSVARLWTLRWKLTLVKKFRSPSAANTLLDYGCGTGQFLNYMKRNGFKVAGIEPSVKARSAAELLTGQKIAETINGVNNHYGVITLWHVLEHVPDLNETLSKIKQTLEESGTLMIAVPNYQSYDSQHYGMHWAAYDVPRHLWHFSQQSMEQLLTKHKLRLVTKLPMKLDAFYVSMLSEKNKRSKHSIQGLTAAMLSGISSNLKAKNNNYSSIIYIARHAH